jgi:adenosylcobinamide-GDP ribazoletransferase
VASGLRAGVAAAGFLTRLPLGHLELGADDVARGSFLFPLVGAGIGALTGLAAVGFATFLPPLLAAGLAVAFEALLTGGLHLDGLADTADALGARSRARALEVMPDPATGAFGATALVVDVLVKVAAVAALLDAPGAVPAVAAAWALGRAAPLALSAVLPYAGSGTGTGRALTDAAGAPRLGLGVALGVGLALVIAGFDAGAAVAGAATAAVVVGLGARKALGGVTGDVLGAAAELGTTLALVGAVAAA